jgi:hypothetical protein
MSGQVLHFDPATGKIAQFVGRSKNLDANGKHVKDVSVGGIDIRQVMKNSKQKTSEHAEKEAQLKQVAASDAGLALLDGVPALYAALEGLEDEPGTAKLLEPFGSVALILQLTTKQFRGFRGADKVLGSDKAKELSSACKHANDCVLRGKSFTIHSFGLFDPLSKQTDAPAPKSGEGEESQGPPQVIHLPRSEISRELVESLTGVPLARRVNALSKDGNGRCDTMTGQYFGACGLGTVTPGNFWTPECFGHDYCVCAYSHLDCVNEIPSGCGVAQGITCHTLWGAAASWFDAIWDMIGDWWSDFWEWVDSWFEDDDCPPGVVCQY